MCINELTVLERPLRGLPLSIWQVLLTTNSPVTPAMVTLPVTADLVRFVSIQIGP